MDYKRVFESSVSGLHDYLKVHGLKSMVLGISGGIDSTVCAIICREVTRLDPTLSFYGVSLPCTTNTVGEIGTADKVGASFVENYWTHEFQEEYETIERWVIGGAGFSTPISKGNIKARLRMIYLRNLAGIKGGVVIDTDNLSENFLGFFTIAGDQGDISLVAQLWKHEIYELADWLLGNHLKEESEKEALRCSISLTPTDGNGVGDGGDLGQIAPSLKSYTELDEILMCYVRYREKPTEANLYFLNLLIDKYGEETVTKIIQRSKGTEYKRHKLPIVLTLEGIDRGEPSKEELMKHVGRS